MKKLLIWITSPFACYSYVRDKEQMLLFCTACMHKEIEDPTIWDIDSLTEAINDFLAVIHRDPHIFDGTPEVKKGLFWTTFLSRFKQLTFNRDNTRHYMETYGMLKNAINYIQKNDEECKNEKKFNPSPVDIFTAWKLVVSGFVFG